MKKIFLLFLSLQIVFGLTDLEEFAESSRQFSSSLYNKLPQDDNILVSPFSLETILALIQSGAKDETAAEIRATLYLPDSSEEIENIIKDVLPTIESNQYTLQTANKIYVQDNYSIKSTFKTIATDVYEAEIENLDFTQNVEAAEEINQWVEDNTNNEIHDIVSSKDLGESTRLVLVNTLYFDGNWSVPFETNSIKKANFFSNSDNTIETDFLYQYSEIYNYAESEELDAQILELPFKGDQASVVIVLPKTKEGVAAFENKIDTVLATPTFTKTFVQVSLPKFKIESTIDFSPVLQSLGIHKAFGAMEADLSGIAGNPGEIYIDKVVQKTFLNVNEVGVVAAAATVVGIPVAVVPPPPSKNFTADHPFFFYIKVNGIILFEGKVLEPKIT